MKGTLLADPWAPEEVLDLGQRSVEIQTLTGDVASIMRAIRHSIVSVGSDISRDHARLDLTIPLAFRGVCHLAWAVSGARVPIGYKMDPVVVSEVADRVQALCSHVLIYVGLAFEDNACVDEEDESKEDRIYRKLYSRSC